MDDVDYLLASGRVVAGVSDIFVCFARLPR